MGGKEDSPLTETALVAILERALEEKFGQIRETMNTRRLVLKKTVFLRGRVR